MSDDTGHVPPVDMQWLGGVARHSMRVKCQRTINWLPLDFAFVSHFSPRLTLFCWVCYFAYALIYDRPIDFVFLF